MKRMGRKSEAQGVCKIVIPKKRYEPSWTMAFSPILIEIP